MSRRLVTSVRAADRLEVAVGWLSRPAGRVLVVAANAASAGDLFRRASMRHGASFGWDRITFAELAAAIAAPDLATRKLAPATRLALDATAARAVSRLGREGGLGRFAPIGDRLGFPQTVSRTLQEVRLAGVEPEDLPADLGDLLSAYVDELDLAHVADPARMLALATERLRFGQPFPWRSVPTLWCDLAIRSPLEIELLAALADAAPDVLAIGPAADLRSVQALSAALRAAPELLPATVETGLGRLQTHLFEAPPAPAAPSPDVEIFSAPGEERECSEIVRRVLCAAAGGVPFDRMAILLRGAQVYRLPLEEALGRANVPGWWSQGSRMPDPAGRAFLSLLACRAERLSARRFAEYLSLGEASTAPDAPPRRWERLLVEAAVIGGLDRWRRRLAGLEASVQQTITALVDDPPLREREERRLAQLVALRAFALPVLELLAGLPEAATWGAWLSLLGPLAEATLREPEGVVEVLRELQPLSPVGPVGLAEVRHVLAPHLMELATPPSARRYGRVFVGPVSAVRGLDFDLVFVVGVGERIFPMKVAEDPLLLDRDRQELPLDTNADRLAEERLLLRLAVGASSGRVVLSWPRLAIDPVRARTPSFYVLEAVRAVEGRVPAHQDLEARAARASAARVDWPAPSVAADAVDDAEYDLATLRDLLDRPEHETRGAARFLVGANPHLERSLRARWWRWSRGLTRWDGLHAPTSTAVVEAAGAVHPSLHPWSATALELYAQCPYRLYLRGVLRLAPREDPAPAERLEPLALGSIVHEVLYLLHVELREAGLLPIRPDRVDDVRRRIDVLVDAVGTRWHDELAPAVERVWQDELAALRGDLRQWLLAAAAEPDWTPERFELAFGLPAHARGDRGSRAEPVRVSEGLLLRGAIDRIERSADGAVRVTDYKTGKARAASGDVVGGGRTLQPLLYALACEALFPDARVGSARLWYVTRAGGFESVGFPLDDAARETVTRVVATVGDAIATASLVAAPASGACRRCEYLPVCGSGEERRVAGKDRQPLEALAGLRELR